MNGQKARVITHAAIIVAVLLCVNPSLSRAQSTPPSNAASAADTTQFGMPAPTSDLGTSLAPSTPNSVVFDPRLVGQDYVLGPGDVFNIDVNPQSDYSVKSITVSQDGNIDYPRVGEVPVNGKTLTEARAIITERLSKYCIDPDVSINLIALRPQVVYVTGGVAQTHILDVRAASNVAKAITLAGGASNRDQLLNVAVLRGDTVLHANVYPILVNGTDDKAKNLDLQAGDIVVVPFNTAQFAISGAIAKPGIYSLASNPARNEGPMRLSDAIALAGNVIEGTSNIGDVRIVRRGPDGKPISKTYDYGKALQGDESQNPIIEDKDSIFVPTKSKRLDPFALPSFLYFFQVLGL